MFRRILVALLVSISLAISVVPTSATPAILAEDTFTRGHSPISGTWGTSENPDGIPNSPWAGDLAHDLRGDTSHGVGYSIAPTAPMASRSQDRLGQCMQKAASTQELSRFSATSRLTRSSSTAPSTAKRDTARANFVTDSLELIKRFGGVETVLMSTPLPPRHPNNWLDFRFFASNSGGVTTLYAKAWYDAFSPEPVGYQVSANDNSPLGMGYAGMYFVWSVLGDGYIA